MVSRREFARLGTLAALGTLGCSGGNPATPGGAEPARSSPPVEGSARLGARWHAPTLTLASGEQALGLGDPRDGYIRLPSGYRSDRPAPLALLLHGSGRDAHEWAGGFPILDELGVIALAVDSRGVTWERTFAADVAFIDAALAKAFDSCNVDPARVGIAGFSDGASYALSLGLANGDLFTHVLGFSPGHVVAAPRQGRPPVFLSHGTQDPILPVTFTRALADQLRQQGYVVDFREFQGGHELPTGIGQQAFGWFVSV
jgi:phospholipase/carboxylesterase